VADGPLLVAQDAMTMGGEIITYAPLPIFMVAAGLLLWNIYWGVRKP
jgi:hypothetical protein